MNNTTTRIICKSSILNLYKSLIRYGKQLKYTDKNYYRNYIRNQFEASREETNVSRIERLFTKGQAFLDKKRLI